MTPPTPAEGAGAGDRQPAGVAEPSSSVSSCPVLAAHELLELPGPDSDPLTEIAHTMALAPNDWSSERAGAALWAIVFGYSCDDTSAEHVHDDIDCDGPEGHWDAVAARHGWSATYVQRLRALHAHFLQLRTEAP